MRWFSLVCVALAALFLSVPARAQIGSGASAQTLLSRGMFPFALPPFDGQNGPTDVSFLNEMPAGKSGFVRVQGDGFVDGRGKPLRFWGVNLNFNGVFPSKTDAPRIAARLAKFGFNAVRMHHFEGQATPLGLWTGRGNSVKRPWEIDADQLDRFDFFAAELIKRGIYLNINLHVARKVSETDGFVGAARFPEKDKGIAYFEPKLGALNRDFARTLLTHQNPYTGRAYKDEPGVCALEVDNENSLLSLWMEDKLADLPPAYADKLRDRWNAWLRAKYASQGSFVRAYTENDTAPSGPEILLPTGYVAPAPVVNAPAPNSVDQFIGPDGTVLPILPSGNSMTNTAPAPTLNGWKLNLAGGAAGNLSRDNLGGPPISGIVQPGLNAQLNAAGSVSWAFQMVRDGLRIESGKVYTFSFWARANAPRLISVNLWEDRAPYGWLGLSQSLRLSSDWQQFTVGFKPSGATPGQVRLSLNLGNESGAIQFGELSVRAGGRVAAPAEWKLGDVPIIDANHEPIFAARRDFARFLGDLEADYLREMRDFLKKDVGVRVPIWHTQAQFGGWGGLVRENASDAIDVHIYWKHPNFGTTGWNGGNWTVENQSLAANPLGDPLASYSMLRVPGKPFVVSEFNSGQPNDYGAESLLMAATTAAHQGWAGVWVFDYHSTGDWDRKNFEGFFSIDSHPLKMATAPAAALIFRRGDAATATTQTTLYFPRDREWDEVANTPAGPSMGPYLKTWNAAGAPPVAAFTGKVATQRGIGTFVSSSVASLENPGRWISDTGQITRNGRAGWFRLNSSRSKIWVGPTNGQSMTLGELRGYFARTSNVPWSSGALSSLDGMPISQSKRMLLVTAGRAENIGMGWNPQRTSVGQNWGSGPTYVSAPEVSWRLLSDVAALRVWALDESGQRRALVPSTYRGGALKFATSAALRTVWYEIEGVGGN